MRGTPKTWAESNGFAFAAFVVVGAVLYGATLGAQFVHDDTSFFVQRSDVRAWSYLRDTWGQPSLNDTISTPYRPLTFATFALNFLLFGESPASFHAVNVLLNALACWLAFLLVDRLFRRRDLAWFVALLFASFPIHVEAVAFVKSRDELLATVFGLASWLAFLTATSGEASRPVRASFVAAACSLLAFLSKETALVLPGVLGGTLLLTDGWRGVRRAWVPLCLQAAAIAVFFAMRAWALRASVPAEELMYVGQNPLGYAGPEFVPWTAATLFFIAVSKTFVPWNLSPTYGFNHVPLADGPFDTWMAPAGVALAVGLVALAAMRRTRSSPFGIGALAFLVLYFPMSKIPIVHSVDHFGERWLYAPSIGLAMIGGCALWYLWQRRRAAAAVACAAIAIAYGWVLFPYVAAWRDETSLGERMVRSAPNAVTAYTFLATNRLQNGRAQEAIDLIARGMGITEDHAPLQRVAAMTALAIGRHDLAETAIARAERLFPEFKNDLLRSQLLLEQHRFQESLDVLRGSPFYDERDYRARQLMAASLWRLGRTAEARTYFDWDENLPMKMTDAEKIHVLESL